MPIGIAFIRGINVGGKNLLPMADLRAMCEGLGRRDAQTYIQSGNLVFRAGTRELANAAAALEGAIEKKCGFRPRVVVRTLDELRAVVAQSPFASRRGLLTDRLLVMFLTAPHAASAQRTLDAIGDVPEEVRLAGREAYLYFPNGIARPKLPMATVERAVGVPGTCRNWNTIGKLVEMGEDRAQGEDDGEAWAHLGWAGTSPAFRRRGAQSALIAARVSRAAELGATWCTSETINAPGMDTSYRNLQRCGFTPVIQ